MKSIALSILFIFNLLCESLSQNFSINTFQNVLLREYQNKLNNIEKNYEGMEGSPYLTEQFVNSEVLAKFGLFKNVKMKYNISEDAFLFDIDGKIQYLDPNPSIIKVIYDNQTFLVREYNYNLKLRTGFLVRLDSGQVSIFAKKNVTIRPSEPPKALEAVGKPARFITQSNQYYLQLGSGNLVEIDGIKDIYQLFPDKEQALKNLIKKGKLSLKKEKDLIEIIRFCSLGL